MLRALALAAVLLAVPGHAQSRFDSPHYYNGYGGQLLLAVGAGGHALVTASPPAGLATVSLRAGWSSAGRPSLELRGGVDLLLGARTGVSALIGGLWMPLALGGRVFLGLSAEGGVLLPFDGRPVGFAARGGPMLSWRPAPTYSTPCDGCTVEPSETSRFQLELGLGDVVFTHDGVAAVAVGASLRAALRF